MISIYTILEDKKTNIGFAAIPEKSFLKNLVEFQNYMANEHNLLPLLGIERNLPHITVIQGSFIDELYYEEVGKGSSLNDNKKRFLTNILYNGIAKLF